LKDPQPSPSARCRQSLRSVADIGDFFALDRPDLAGVPLSELVDSPEAYTSRIGATRRALARLLDRNPDELPRRPIASLVFLGISARLVAPTLATATLDRMVPELWLEDVTAAELADGRLVLRLTRFHALNQGPSTPISELVALIGQHLIAGQIGRLVHAFSSRDALHPRLLWGNVASTVASAAKLINQRHPRQSDTTGMMAGLILNRPPLARCGHLTRDRGGIDYHRLSCCLYYQFPDAGTCGDCPLPDTAGTGASSST
jgi:ferric iron reductase protein FhuF